MNFFLFAGLVLAVSFFLGKLLERFRIPWVFAALLLGAALSLYNPFAAIIGSSLFETLAQTGMYFLLFLIGFELNLGELRKRERFILSATLFIILLEAALGSLVVHFLFGYSWATSAIVALSFATVGEAILIPILREFNLVNTSLGQAIIGIGSADDIIEILLLLVVGFMIGGTMLFSLSSLATAAALAALLMLTAGLFFIGKRRTPFAFANIESQFLFLLMTFFLFVGIGQFAEASALAALLSGISVRVLIPDDHLAAIERELSSLIYGLFAPFFFLWAGLEIDVRYLAASPLLVLGVAGTAMAAKLLGSYLAGRRVLGARKALLMGVGLSVRFSTGIIVMKILWESGVVGTDIYSVVVASSIVFLFVVPFLFTFLLAREARAAPRMAPPMG